MTKRTADNSLISINAAALNTINTVFGKDYTSEDDIRKYFDSTDGLLNALFEKLVPGTGCADTVAGECVRAICRVSYRYYNDGDLVGYGYGVETASSSLGYIVAQLPEVEGIAKRMIDYTDDCDEYEDQLNYLIEKSLESLLTKRANYFDLSNDDDSRDDWSDVLFDDYSERARYPEMDDEDEEEEDYYEYDDEDDEYYEYDD